MSIIDSAIDTFSSGTHYILDKGGDAINWGKDRGGRLISGSKYYAGRLWSNVKYGVNDKLIPAIQRIWTAFKSRISRACDRMSTFAKDNPNSIRGFIVGAFLATVVTAAVMRFLGNNNQAPKNGGGANNGATAV